MSTNGAVSSNPPSPPPSLHVTEKDRDDPFWSTRGTSTLLMPSPGVAEGASASGRMPSPFGYGGEGKRDEDVRRVGSSGSVGRTIRRGQPWVISRQKDSVPKESWLKVVVVFYFVDGSRGIEVLCSRNMFQCNHGAAGEGSRPRLNWQTDVAGLRLFLHQSRVRIILQHVGTYPFHSWSFGSVV